MKLTVRVDTHLRFKPDDLPSHVIGMLHQALSIRDEEDPANNFDMFGADMHGNFTAPRGFALKLRKGLEANGIEVVWDDRRVLVPAAKLELLDFVQERDYQLKAISRMLSVEQGVYEAPPGSGKTISAASFIAQSGQRTIVLVDKINIATQWVSRLKSAYGPEVKIGLIGDGAWEEQDITVAIRQSLWAARERLDASGWWATWGAVILDECHAISALTVREIMQRFPAFYRIGLSATPDRHDYLTMASRAIIGEIFCRTTDRELEDAGVLVRPRIIAVKTPFLFEWKTGPRANPQAQWQSMLKALKFDKARNRQIGQLIGQQRGHTVLVHTDHKGHAHELAGYALANGWPDDKVFMLTGDQDSEQRDKVIALAAHGDVVIFSTIGQEAMDIPRLDRFFLVFPTKNTAMTTQMLGRLKRTHESKTEAPIVFDMWDNKVFVLNKHFYARRGTYDSQELPFSVM